MKDFFFYVLIATLLFGIGSCEKSDSEIVDPAPYTVENENYTFHKNTGVYLNAQKNRSESYSHSFEIESVKRTGNIMQVNVVFPAGCTNNQFEIIWDGKIMESHPVQTRVFVKRMAEECVDSEEKERLALELDLDELIFKKGDDQLQNAVIIVSNASKKPNMENSDIPVSSN